MQHYCFQCGAPLEMRWVEQRERETCPKCEWIHFAQLKVGAAVLIEEHGKLLLLQRSYEPWKDSWMIPAGYVEADEDPRDAARREVYEETGLDVELSGLIQVYYFDDDPRGNGVSFVYKAEKVFGNLKVNSESRDAKYFSWSEIPSYLTKGGHDKMISAWRTQAQQKEMNLERND